MRVAALNEELVAVFSQALGNNCSKAQIFDVATFVDHFGTSDLRCAVSHQLFVSILFCI